MNKFTYNMFYEIEKPTVILSSVHHKHYGVLENIDMDSFQCNFNMNSAQEISFDVYKYMDEHLCSLWDKLISFKYIYIPSHNEYYKIDVTLDQDNKTVKHITGTSAGEFELSQRKILSLEINTASDLTYYEQKNPDTGEYEEIPSPENTKTTKLYDPDDTHKSLLHRVIADRAPDWSIGYVDETVANKERMFSVSNQTIYDFLTSTVATELDILFKFDSVNRVISVYDLLNYCEDCGERGDFTDKCDKCGGTNIRRGYGEDSHIFISASNYANKITVDGDEGNVKNCFRVIGGDDLMTATVKNCNPAGSEYIYKFSEADYDDMPDELVQKLKDYAEEYKRYENGDDIVTPPIRPYSDITKDYYNALTEYYYYKTSMMPRTDENGADIGHWKPTTDDDHPQTYNVGQTCYTITLPSYCHLVCVEAGQSGHTEFDCTDVILPSDPTEEVIIDEHDFDPTATVKWKVVRNIVSIPLANQALNDIKTYVAKSDTIVYFEDSFPVGVTTTPQTFTTINKYVKDLLATVVNPLFKIEILNSGSQTSNWESVDSKNGILSFYLQLTNTTNPKDVARTIENDTWYALNIKCCIADSIKQHQEYMQELVEKRLNKKDENFTSIWQTEKRKADGQQLSGSSATIDLGFVPQYVVVEYTTSDGHYTRIHNYDGTETGSGGTISIVDTSTTKGFSFTSTKADVLIYYTAVSDADFAGVIQQYSLDLLNGFMESYYDCRNVLISNKITDPESRDFHGVDLYSTMYEPYNHKIKLLEAEIAERERTVKKYYNSRTQIDDGNDIPVGNNLPYDPEMPEGLVQQYGAEMQAVNDALNMQKFLKDETAEDPDWMWKTLFNYLREGEYQNSNIISDGLANNTLVEYAKELLDKGNKELAKATELQYSLTDELGNLLNTEDFAPFKDKFNLGDYIICGIGDNKDNLDVDDHNYKLRLISLSYTYGSPESVSVTFANVTKIKNYFSDTQDILAQAKSMGTSYTAVTHQVEKNADTTATINSWNQNGLNSALTRIMNNSREEVTYDNSGILIKQYDYDYDETKDNKTYGDEQLRLTHDILCFTKDNWKTASLGLGKQDYIYYDNNGVRTSGTDYGVIAKFVDAGFIRGSQFIGGELYSDKTYDDNGTAKPVTHMNYNNGTFEMAEGRIKFYYDSDQNPQLDIKANVEIQGDITVKDTNNREIFKADVANHFAKIGGWTAGATNLWIQNGTNYVTFSDGSNNHQDVIVVRQGTEGNYTYPFHLHADGRVVCSKLTATGTITGSTITGSSFVNDGSYYTTTISSDTFEISGKDTQADNKIIITVGSFDPSDLSLCSGTISASGQGKESRLTGQTVISPRFSISGRANNIPSTITGYPPYCGYLYAVGNDTNGYYGRLSLNGNGADILINDTSITKFVANEKYDIDWYGGALVTGGGKEIHFTLPLPKNAYGRTVTSSLNATALYDGKYIIGSSSGAHYAAITPTISVQSDGYALKFSLTKSSAYANAPTYGSVGIRVFGTLTFT